jgi:peptide/nickel transport system substrate-binding protein
MHVPRSLKLLVGSSLAIVLVFGVSACGSSNKGGTGTVTVLMGTAPNSLDPALGASLQSAEATWITYTGLVTYGHNEGQGGTVLIPGVAQSLPKVSSDGRTYTFKLRKNLVYSNGAPLKASDVVYAIERSMRLNWGGKGLLIEHIVGAEAFDAHKASSIAGIVANDATGTITFRLTAPYGPFLNVLAFPAVAPVPSGTPMVSLSSNPPPGVGPYKISSVVPNRSFSVVRNPYWSNHPIPGIPSGNVDVNVKIVSNNQTETEQVLNGSADVFDFNDVVPGTLLSQVERQAAGRFLKESTASDEFFFLNVKTKPFESQLVREAVEYALDRSALARLAGGTLESGCFLLPPGIVGHPIHDCPYGNTPNLAKAKELVARSGLRGSPVTVWSGERAPHKEFVDYYASVLNAIGLKASVKLVADEQYPSTVGNLRNNAQTGWLSFSQDFPNPSDFYQLLDAHSILPQENHNLSQVDDPHIQSELAVLSPVPSSRLGSVETRWQALDEYTARKAYMVVFGYDSAVKLVSSRIDFNSTVFNGVYGMDWSLLRLK